MPAPVTLLNTSILPKIAIRDGYTGANARLYLPFSNVTTQFNGYWFNSGQILTFRRSQIPQNRDILLIGRQKANTYMKDCCTCL